MRFLNLFRDRVHGPKHELYECSIFDDVKILGHVFHGLQDIHNHVEMSLYRSYERGSARVHEPSTRCRVHVGEMWKPYPCFDAEDYANENRTYRNYIFRTQPITQDDMKCLSDLPYKSDDCRVSEEVPLDMRPMVYYVGDGEIMLVAV